jgi:hypothetical protein
LRQSAHAAHVLRENLAWMNAADKVKTQIAMAGKKHVLGLSHQAGTDADSFLPAAHIHTAEDLAWR